MNKNIPLFKVSMSNTAATAVTQILNSGYIGQGIKVDEFETKLNRWFDNDNVLTVNSGTSALHLSLHLLKKTNVELGAILDWPGLDEESEVLSSPLTCTATNWPILANNLKIRWVDVDPLTLNMDLQDLERKITNNTRVILVVHWGGIPVDLNELDKILDKTQKRFGFRPVVIEDCAHSMGSTFDKETLGTKNIACYSFQAIKHLTSVDGGSIVFPSHKKELYERGRLLRWYGIDREGDRKDFRCEANVPEWGFKFHMNDVNATVGIENLKELPTVIKSHRDNAKFYTEQLKDRIKTQEVHSKADPSYWLYTIFVENRTAVMKYLKEKGIMSSRVHERNDKHSCVKEYACHLPSLDYVSKKMLCIPVGWWVTEEDREYIIECLKRVT